MCVRRVWRIGESCTLSASAMKMYLLTTKWWCICVSWSFVGITFLVDNVLAVLTHSSNLYINRYWTIGRQISDEWYCNFRKSFWTPPTHAAEYCVSLNIRMKYRMHGVCEPRVQWIRTFRAAKVPSFSAMPSSILTLPTDVLLWTVS